MKYPQVKDNEWVQPVRRKYKMACCDCGLVHEMDFRLVKHTNGGKLIQLRARRHVKATAAIRRGMKKGKRNGS